MFSMKKTKRIISVVLCALMLVMALASCGDKKEEKDVKTVTIWSNTGSEKAFWTEKVEEFNNTIGKEKGIKLDFEATTDASYTQKLDVAIQSNELPDFFFSGSLKQLVELDLIAPIDNLPETKKLIEKYKDCFQEGVNTYKGKTYMLVSGTTTRGLIYNKEMFKKAGIVDEKGEAKPPVTFDEMREVAKKLTNKSKKQFGIVLPIKWQSWTDSDILTLAQSSFGIPCYDPVKQEYDYTILEPIIEAYMGMNKDGSVYPGAESLDNDPARARFAEGGIGMKIAYFFDYGVLAEQFPAQFDWGVAPLPVVDADKCYKQNGGYGWNVRVSKKGMERLGEDIVDTIMAWWHSDEIVIDLYKRGLSVPAKWDIVKDVKVDDDKAQWKEFCEMSAITAAEPLKVPTNMEGVASLRDIIVNDIWGKGADVTKTLKDYTKKANEGIKKYRDLYPDKDYTVYEYKEWDISR